MSIKVCNAIMGSGKTSATIAMFNANPDKKYIYITPYLDEATRISKACPALEFAEPRSDLPEFSFRKHSHTLELLREGRNVASTHRMFTMYTQETISLIKKQGYTLVVDEDVDIFQNSMITDDDMRLLRDAKWISGDEGDSMDVNPGEYRAGRMMVLANMAKSNRLVRLMKSDGSVGNKVYYWMLSKELFQAFEDVYVLTYLFEYQLMKYYFDINDIHFDYIGISHPSEHEYYFCDNTDYIPSYVLELDKKIHIFDNKKLNRIGDDRCALSSGWHDRAMKDSEHKELTTLRKNIYNFFRNYNSDKPASSRLWSTFSKVRDFLATKGFLHSYLPFNMKATNAYSDKSVLAYCVNVFMQTCVKQHLYASGVNVNEDGYALSIMVQWIWRSAIRKGEEIWIYIPSKRMRDLLATWIKTTQESYLRSLHKEG